MAAVEAAPMPCVEATTLAENAAAPGAEGGEGSEVMKALRSQIMRDIDEKLSQKEERLWRRGQVEINRLKVDQKEVQTCVNKLQVQQEALLTESQHIRFSVGEVTSRFELIINEMRDIIRALPMHTGSATARDNTANSLADCLAGVQLSPSPSLASTSASEVANTPGSWGTAGGAEVGVEQQRIAGGEATLESVGAPPAAAVPGAPGVAVPPALPAADAWMASPWLAAAGGREETGADGTQGAAGAQGADEAAALMLLQGSTDANAVPAMPTMWWGSTASPTVPSPAVLSLASVLPSSPAPPTPNPATGCRRLALAECLENQGHSESTPAAPASFARQLDFVTVELIKEPGFVTLGVEVNQVDGGSLRVEGIDEHGVVGMHNSRQESNATKVRIGDRIVEANGIKCDAVNMLQECKLQPRLVLTLARESSSAAKDSTSEDDVSSIVAAREVATPATPAKAAASPGGSRLRPDASVFVPSAQKEQPPAMPALSEGSSAAPGSGAEGRDTAA